MLGNPKGEVLICSECERTHDIKRGTICTCACGNRVVSKEYIEDKNWQDYKSNLTKERFDEIIKAREKRIIAKIEKGYDYWENNRGAYVLPQNYRDELKESLFFNVRRKLRGESGNSSND